VRSELVGHFRTTEEWEVFEEASRSLSIRVTSGVPIQADLMTGGVGVRLISAGRLGFASTTDVRQAEAATNWARKSAEFGSPSGFAFAPPQEYPEVFNCDAELENLTAEQMREWLCAALQRRELRRIPNFVASAQLRTVTCGLTNHNGVDAEHKSSVIELDLSGALCEGFDRLRECEKSSRFDIDAEAAIDRFLERYHRGQQVPRAASVKGNLPVVFAGHAIAALLQVLEDHLITIITRRREVLPLLQDQRVMDEQVAITDCAAESWLPGAAPFDGEGVARRNLRVLEQGRLISFITDQCMAAHIARQSTGNAVRRGFNSLPKPGFHNPVLRPGKIPVKDLVADLHQGLLIEDLHNVQTGRGAFGDFIAKIGLGYWVKNEGSCRSMHLVRSTSISGNICNLLGDSLVAIGLSAQSTNRLLPAIMTRETHVFG